MFGLRWRSIASSPAARENARQPASRTPGHCPTQLSAFVGFHFLWRRLLSCPFGGRKLGAQPLGVVRSRIVVKSLRGVELVPVRHVRYFLADQKYVTIHYGKGETITTEVLARLEAEFKGRFLRVHRNALVAIKFIDGLVRLGPRRFELRITGLSERIPVSRRRVATVRLALEARVQRAAGDAPRPPERAVGRSSPPPGALPPSRVEADRPRKGLAGPQLGLRTSP